MVWNFSAVEKMIIIGIYIVVLVLAWILFSYLGLSQMTSGIAALFVGFLVVLALSGTVKLNNSSQQQITSYGAVLILAFILLLIGLAYSLWCWRTKPTDQYLPFAITSHGGFV